MAINPADMIFFEAQFANDETYGGGPMSGNVVQDGVSKNVFPLIGELDAALGRTQLRKVYAAVVSASGDELLNASVGVWTPPDDSNVDVVAFTFGGTATTRAEAVAAIAVRPYVSSGAGGGVNPESGEPSHVRRVSGASTLQPGERVLVGDFIATVVSVVPSGESYIATFVDDPRFDALPGISSWARVTPNPAVPRAVGVAAITSAAAASATTIAVSRVDGRVVPNLTPYPTAPNGINSSQLAMMLGQVSIIRPGDLAVVHNAGGTVSELVQVTSINYLTNTLTLAAPLANAYADGYVSTLAPLGDLRCELGAGFAQQTWTRVFSDALIGSPISASYSGAVTLTNDGTETERWAIVFTSATDFKLIGETRGQIATGTTTADFMPLNPATNQPFFTLSADGWGTGWQVGNVFRFNTIGPRAPFWMVRCISPDATSVTDGAVIQFRGSY